MTTQRQLSPVTKYGWLCEWHRWIGGRHYTFRVHGNHVIATKWDAADLWVQEERRFYVNDAYYRFLRAFGLHVDCRPPREHFRTVVDTHNRRELRLALTD